MQILLLEVKKILEFLSQKIPYNTTSKTKVPPVYLEILNKLFFCIIFLFIIFLFRISIFVEDDKMGETFAITFLSYLGSRRIMTNKDRMIEIFSTLSSLSKHLSDPLYALK